MSQGSIDHEAIRTTARNFAQREVAPHARAWDEQERFPSEIIPKLAELGFWGIRIDERYGGAGLDTTSYAIIVEELARVDGSLALTVASHNGLGSSHLARFGPEPLKQKHLPALASGKYLGAWALTEPGSGSDAAALATTAVRDGDHWVLNGSKMFITQGSVGGVCVVLAKTSPDKKQKGVTAFLVERGTEGFTASPHIQKLGCRSSDTAELRFENVRVADEHRIGEVDMGFMDTLRILDRGRISIAAMALGLAQGAHGAAVRYSLDRQQFGQPISNFQAIQWMLADNRKDIEASRALVYHASALADSDQSFSQEASMAKLFASEAATRVCHRSLQIHGGYGYTREFPVERHLRDAKLCEIGEGTSEVQRLVISRRLAAP